MKNLEIPGRSPVGVMNFAHPESLWLLTLFLPVLFWGIRGRLRRLSDWQSLAQRGRVSRQGTLALLASVTCLSVALAQPRWGRITLSALPPGHDVVLIVDVSRSMGAEDAVPNRLAEAVEVAESLIRALARAGQPGGPGGVCRPGCADLPVNREPGCRA